VLINITAVEFGIQAYSLVCGFCTCW